MGTRVLEEISKQGPYKIHRTGMPTAPGRQTHDTIDPQSGFEQGDTRRHDTTEETTQQRQMKSLIVVGVGIGSVLAENVLSHPSLVLRRQCQVNHLGESYHLTPFTLFQVSLNLSSSQGGAIFWKGIGSTFAVRATVMAAETAISEVTTFPKDMVDAKTVKKFSQHLLVKSLSAAISTPFYASSLPETVQSDIASERPGIFDCFREGMTRLMGWGIPHTTRLIPVWQLLLPTVSLHLFRYMIMSVAQYSVTSAMRTEQQQYRSEPLEEPEAQEDKVLYEQFFPNLLSSFTGNLLADMMLFPLETVVHRLYVQGTRTIIDNVDTGLGVLPINTRYDGFIDCIKTIFAEEGVTGFYRGFGALVLQYSIHALILKAALTLLKTFSEPTNRSRTHRR